MSKIYKVIVLSLVVLLPAVAFFSWYQVEKYRIRHEVKKKMICSMDRSELSHIKLHRDDVNKLLRWEHDSEFEYAGEMYDIVERVIIGDSIHYYCWRDHEETALNKQLKETTLVLLHKDSQQHHKVNHLIQFYKSLFIDQSADMEDISIAVQQVAAFHFQDVTLTGFKARSNPPPREHA